jgi:hypothetical protein
MLQMRFYHDFLVTFQLIQRGTEKKELRNGEQKEK